MTALKLVTIVLLVSTLCLGSGCFSLGGEWHYEEIGRVKAPDGVVDAVLVRGNGGATTSFSYSVFLVPSATIFDERAPLFEPERALFVADHQKGLELVWRKPRFLEIRFAKARIFRFSNFWHSREVQNYQYVVELRLVPLDDGSSLPEGDKT
jgi:hypothetical protein